MLQHLSIRNYALIEALDINFTDGFTTITGETGAGKSIILGALSLILGSRADIRILHDIDNKCIIEAQFNVSELSMQQFFERYDLDFSTECVMRREITPAGKSRAFINDTPVNLTIMKELGSHLVDIHSQNHTLSLQRNDFQLNILDSLAGNSTLFTQYKALYVQYQNLIKKLHETTHFYEENVKEQDYHKFLSDELISARLKVDEKEELEKESELLEHMEELKGGLFQATEQLNSEGGGILSSLKEIAHVFNKLASFHPDMAELGERLSSLIIELDDICSDTMRLNDQLSFDQEHNIQIAQRLDLIYSLLQKHRVSTVDELLSILLSLNQNIDQVETLADQITALKKEITKAQNHLQDQAIELSKARKGIVLSFKKNTENILHQLGMPDATFLIDIKSKTSPGPDGLDNVTFLFSANKGIAPDILSKVASGGELSRIMLALKSLIANNHLIPTLIFDEIDTGVSGDIAGKMGQIMKEMSNSQQIISITHLPQIAGQGDNHLFVYKETNKNSTISNIKTLSQQERIDTIAKMLSSDNITPAAIEAAKELLSA